MQNTMRWKELELGAEGEYFSKVLAFLFLFVLKASYLILRINKQTRNQQKFSRFQCSLLSSKLHCIITINYNV